MMNLLTCLRDTMQRVYLNLISRMGVLCSASGYRDRDKLHSFTNFTVLVFTVSVCIDFRLQ